MKQKRETRRPLYSELVLPIVSHRNAVYLDWIEVDEEIVTVYGNNATETGSRYQL